MPSASALPGLKGIPLRDFSGGPNLRDAAPELGDNECVDSWNVTYDERGGASSRLGYRKVNSAVFGTTGDLAQNGHYSGILGKRITQAGKKLYLDDSTTSVKTFTTDARVAFADFAGKVVACHQVDGLFTSTDGSTWTAVSDADAPKGSAVAVWKTKLIVTGADAKVYASDLGDPTAWTSTSFNALREKDDEPVVALEGGSGSDFTGRPSLIACKRESTYRIVDPDTLEYETVDATVGAASAVSIISVGAKTITLSKHGIYWWQEGVAGMQNASDRYEPLWSSAQLAFDKQNLWCAGRKGGRAFFSLCSAAADANDISLEYHPEQGWIAPGSDAAAFYMTFADDTEKLYGGSPTVDGQVYELRAPVGTDDGTNIDWRFQTRWLEPNSGYRSMVWQVSIQGRGTGTVTVLKDYATSGGTDYPFDFAGDTPAFDDAHYDIDSFNDPTSQDSTEFFSIGLCHQMSLKITGSASSTFSAAPLLGQGDGPTLGEWAIGGIDVLYVPLGVGH